jgi:hypothetical protein
MSAPGTSAPTAGTAPTPTAAPGAFANTATPTQLYYANAVEVALEANAVNFADSLTQGHRVQVTMPKADMNAHLKWARAVGSDRPVGTFAEKAGFQTKLDTALTEFIDLDGVSSGLNLSAGILADKDSIETQGVNDLVAQYILYKVYGASNYNTTGVVFNVTDLAEMVANADVSLAIADELDDSKDRGEAVDQMFRDLLSSDPKRFFDATGKQLPGLFETNADAAGDGDWKLDAGDVIEIKVNFKFGAAVTRRAVRSDQQPLAADGGALSPAEASVEQEIIAVNEIFPVRLQLRAV